MAVLLVTLLQSLWRRCWNLFTTGIFGSGTDPISLLILLLLLVWCCSKKAQCCIKSSGWNLVGLFFKYIHSDWWSGLIRCHTLWWRLWRHLCRKVLPCGECICSSFCQLLLEICVQFLIHSTFVLVFRFIYNDCRYRMACVWLIAEKLQIVVSCFLTGYPVMIKASAGGGGKGLRIAWNDTDCRYGRSWYTYTVSSNI